MFGNLCTMQGHGHEQKHVFHFVYAAQVITPCREAIVHVLCMCVITCILWHVVHYTNCKSGKLRCLNIFVVDGTYKN